jgi:hypothetical protein
MSSSAWTRPGAGDLAESECGVEHALHPKQCHRRCLRCEAAATLPLAEPLPVPCASARLRADASVSAAFGKTPALDDQRKRHSGSTRGTRCIGTTSPSASSPSVGAQTPSLSQRAAKGSSATLAIEFHATRHSRRRAVVASSCCCFRRRNERVVGRGLATRCGRQRAPARDRMRPTKLFALNG